MQEYNDSNESTAIDKSDDMMAEQNITEKEATREADELFLPRERKELMKDYKSY